MILLAALAGATEILVLAGPADESALASAAETLGAEVTALPPDAVYDPEALSEALARWPGDCAPSLPEDLRADLWELTEAHPDVVLALTARGGDPPLLWRVDPATAELARLFSDDNVELAPAAGGLRLLLLGDAKAARDLDDARRWLGVTRLDLESGAESDPLRRALVASPDACRAPIDAESRALLEGWVGFEEELVVAVVIAKKQARLWHWTAEARELERIPLHNRRNRKSLP